MGTNLSLVKTVSGDANEFCTLSFQLQIHICSSLSLDFKEHLFLDTKKLFHNYI